MLDLMVEQLTVSLVFFFERRLDPAALARGLEEALAVAPPFAGRFDTSGGALRIRCEGQGIPFTVTSSRSTLALAIRSILDDGGAGLVDIVSPRRARRGKDPLFRVRVTHLEGGATAIGCSWHHSVGDLQSFMTLMKAWCAAAAGEPVPPPLVVDDRRAYLDRELPAGGSSASGMRRLAGAELARYAFYLAFTARRKKSFQVYFSDDEILRMRTAYAEGGVSVTANDALCAHIAETIAACDPRIQNRNLTIAVNFRKRVGLEPRLLGNMVVGLTVGVARGEPPRAIAQRLRGALDRFAADHMNYRPTQRFADEVGPRALSRCIPTGIDPLARYPVVTSWASFGVYDVRFEGTAPIYFAPITELPVPWLGALVEGFEDRGRIYAGALPDEVAAAMLAPSMLERLHRFRDPADRLPEMLARVGGMS